MTSALIGKGNLLGDQGDYQGALDILQAALSRDPDNLMVQLEAAWYRALCGDYGDALKVLEACVPQIQGNDMRTRSLKSRTLYRIGVCIWNLDELPAARKNRSGAYSRFLDALKADPNFAAAYTSLGLYYADYGRDQKRARKCFLKAIELSASEVVAAERLARGYADAGDWDLVELVAQRVIESGKTRPDPSSKEKALSWPLAALGIVQLNRQEYAKAIVSFQHALRTTPQDYHSWIGLGESYHHSGRYVAATKAFEQAQRMQSEVVDGPPEDDWFARFLSANVKRELSQYEKAAQEYGRILETQPGEFGVAIALVQTLVEGARQSIERGFFGRASDQAREAITHCSSLVEQHSDVFNLWKTVGDACATFSFIHEKAIPFPWFEIKRLLDTRNEGIDYDVLSRLDGVGRQFFQEGEIDIDNAMTVKCFLHAAILAYKRSLSVSANDIHARAVGWYNLGWIEYRADMCLASIPQSNEKKGSSGYLKASIQCFRRAIETEARNSEFWNALGVATSTVNPAIAQHAFVRSLYLNDKV